MKIIASSLGGCIRLFPPQVGKILNRLHAYMFDVLLLYIRDKIALKRVLHEKIE